jgi:hypothetical protein
MREARAVTRANADMAAGMNGLPWVSTQRRAEGVTGVLAYQRSVMFGATEAVRGYSGALGQLTDAEQEALEMNQRFTSAFKSELVDAARFMRETAEGATEFDSEGYIAALNEGLINAQGLVNVEAMNKALYEQTQAAGASAATLAMLGVATGQFSEEQAEAALKAAILQEQINRIAEAVTAGDLTLGEALGALSQVQQGLDTTNIDIGVEANGEPALAAVSEVDAALMGVTNPDEPWQTVLNMDIQEVIEGTDEAKRLLERVPATRTITINWQQTGPDIVAALQALGVTL